MFRKFILFSTSRFNVLSPMNIEIRIIFRILLLSQNHSTACHTFRSFAHGPSKDILHSIHQGIACVLIAALVCDHWECKVPGMTLKDLDTFLSRDTYKHYKRWCKMKGNVATPCSHRFSASRFGKEKWASFPELGSVYKAAVVKTMMFWCADFLKEHDIGVIGGELRTNTMHAFAAFQNLVDLNGPWFDPDIAQKVVDFCRTGLLLYQKLVGLDKSRKDGRQTYKIIPKFHSCLELSIYIEETHRNPRYLKFKPVHFFLNVWNQTFQNKELQK